jgi:hypothetical protein
MKKSEKRRIGEARQAEFAKENREAGLHAQRRAHEIAEKRKASLAKIAAKENARQKKVIAAGAMRLLGENASKAAKSMQEFVTVGQDDDAPGLKI